MCERHNQTLSQLCICQRWSRGFYPLSSTWLCCGLLLASVLWFWIHKCWPSISLDLHVAGLPDQEILINVGLTVGMKNTALALTKNKTAAVLRCCMQQQESQANFDRKAHLEIWHQDRFKSKVYFIMHLLKLKGTVDPKIQIIPLFTHPCVISNVWLTFFCENLKVFFFFYIQWMSMGQILFGLQHYFVNILSYS